MKVLGKLAKAAAAGLILAYGLSFAGRWHFMLDNLSSFQIHFAFSFATLALFFLLSRENAWLGVASFGLAASLTQIAPWYVPMQSASAASGDRSIAVLSSNILARSKSGHRLVELVQAESPELVGVVELTPNVVDALSSVRAAYPYHMEAAEMGTKGLGLYSRLPLSDARLLVLGEDLPGVIAATLIADQTRVEILLVHPDAPMTAKLSARRNLQLKLLAEYVRTSGRQTIVLGDLNVAMWSPYYKDFVSASGLRNAREGDSIAGTWPAVSGLAVPIDHILTTSDISVHEFHVLPSIGSDHFPIAARIVLPNRS
jgi:endonuclease/exonuclease/phosphatase (EEP) superfamily protein YafD